MRREVVLGSVLGAAVVLASFGSLAMLTALLIGYPSGTWIGLGDPAVAEQLLALAEREVDHWTDSPHWVPMPGDPNIPTP